MARFKIEACSKHADVCSKLIPGTLFLVARGRSFKVRSCPFCASERAQQDQSFSAEFAAQSETELFASASILH